MRDANSKLDAVAAEAVKQTLDALGPKADPVGAAADGAGPASLPPAGAAPDLTALLAGQAETNALLARIAAALERQSFNNEATY